MTPWCTVKDELVESLNWLVRPFGHTRNNVGKFENKSINQFVVVLNLPVSIMLKSAQTDVQKMYAVDEFVHNATKNLKAN